MKLPAIVMAGGKSVRFGRRDKPLALFTNRPLVEHVLSSLENARSISRICVVTSPWTEKTEDYLRGRWRVLRAPGNGYVEDMVYALKELNSAATLVVAADLPLLRPEDVDFVVEEYSKQEEPALAVMIPLDVFKKTGLTPTSVYRVNRDLVPAGINVVNGKDLNGPQRILVTDNIRYAVNVNTQEDLLFLHRKAFK